MKLRDETEIRDQDSRPRFIAASTLLMKPNPQNATALVIDFLRRHDEAAALLPAALRNLRLQQDVLALMPAVLRETCEVAGCEAETVILRVSSAGAAAKLRQTLPRLRDGLLDRGWQVSSIRVRVQPSTSAVGSVPRVRNSHAAISPDGVTAFVDLADQLSESPLKAAVDRLIRRRRTSPPR